MTAQAKERLTSVLSREHVVVLARLDELDKAAADGNVGAVRGVLSFLREGLVLHRRKEEEVLFPALEPRFGRGVGPVACMLEEHKLEADLIADLERALAAESERAHVRPRARRLVEHLRNHIWKEDNVLFPMAESLLDESEREQVRGAFRRIGACCPSCGHDSEN